MIFDICLISFLFSLFLVHFMISPPYLTINTALAFIVAIIIFTSMMDLSDSNTFSYKLNANKMSFASNSKTPKFF